MKLNSTKDYLEAILNIYNRNGLVRSIDISRELEVSKPSVHIAVKKLQEKGLISLGEKGDILFTDSGRKAAEEALRKHKVLCEVLERIGVKKDIVYQEAGKIERVISEETFECFLRLLQSCRNEIVTDSVRG
ncbi:MAG: metal-dependent transcriptional regulator [Acetatifactor sp.]|nr:metal-dependent transcriptional regulator [Acetatifactor sp.]